MQQGIGCAGRAAVEATSLCLCRRRGVTSMGWPKPKFKIDAGKQGRVRLAGLVWIGQLLLLLQGLLWLLLLLLLHDVLSADEGSLTWLLPLGPLQVIKISGSLGKVNELNFNSGECASGGERQHAAPGLTEMYRLTSMCLPWTLPRRVVGARGEQLHAGAPDLADLQVSSGHPADAIRTESPCTIKCHC